MTAATPAPGPNLNERRKTSPVPFVHAAHEGRTDAEPTARERAAWRDMTATANLTVYLAEIGGQPVGTANGWWSRSPDGLGRMNLR